MSANLFRLLSGGVVLVGLGFGATACDNNHHTSRDAGDVMRDAGNDTGDAVKDAADKTGDAVKDAADEVHDRTH